jgi:hypothetical protein
MDSLLFIKPCFLCFSWRLNLLDMTKPFFPVYFMDCILEMILWTILIYLFSWFFFINLNFLYCLVFYFTLYCNFNYCPFYVTSEPGATELSSKVGLTFVSTSGSRIFTWMTNLQVVTSAYWTVWLKLFHYRVYGYLQFNGDSQTVGHKPLRSQQKASLLLSKKYYLYTHTYNIHC